MTSLGNLRDRLAVGEVNTSVIDSRPLRDSNGQTVDLDVRVPMGKTMRVSTDGTTMMRLGRNVLEGGQLKNVFELGSTAMPMEFKVHHQDADGNNVTFEIERTGAVRVAGTLHVEGVVEQTGSSTVTANNGIEWKVDGETGAVHNAGDLTVGTSGNVDLSRSLSVYNTVQVGKDADDYDNGILRVSGRNGQRFLVDGADLEGMRVSLDGELNVSDRLVIHRDGDVSVSSGVMGSGGVSIQTATLDVNHTGAVRFVGVGGDVQVGQHGLGGGKDVTFHATVDVDDSVNVELQERNMHFDGATGDVSIGGLITGKRGLTVESGPISLTSGQGEFVVTAQTATINGDLELNGAVKIGSAGVGRGLTYHADEGRDTVRDASGNWVLSGDLTTAPSSAVTINGPLSLAGATHDAHLRNKKITLWSSPESLEGGTVLRGGEVQVGVEGAPVPSFTVWGENTGHFRVSDDEVETDMNVHARRNVVIYDGDGGPETHTHIHSNTVEVGGVNTQSVVVRAVDVAKVESSLKVGKFGQTKDVTFFAGTEEEDRSFTFTGSDATGSARFRGSVQVDSDLHLGGAIHHSSATSDASVSASSINLSAGDTVNVSTINHGLWTGGLEFRSAESQHTLTVRGFDGQLNVGTAGAVVNGPTVVNGALTKNGTSEPVSISASDITLTTGGSVGGRIIALRGETEVGEVGSGKSRGLRVFGFSGGQKDFVVSSTGQVTSGNSLTVNGALTVTGTTNPVSITCSAASISTAAGGAFDVHTPVVNLGRNDLPDLGCDFNIRGDLNDLFFSFDKETGLTRVGHTLEVLTGTILRGNVNVHRNGVLDSVNISTHDFVVGSNAGKIVFRGSNVNFFQDDMTPRAMYFRAPNSVHDFLWNAVDGSVTVGGGVTCSGSLSASGGLSVGSGPTSMAGTSMSMSYTGGIRISGSAVTIGPPLTMRNTHPFEIRGNILDSTGSLIFEPGQYDVMNDSHLRLHGRLTVHNNANINGNLTVTSTSGTTTIAAPNIAINANSIGHLTVARTNVSFGTSASGMGLFTLHAPSDRATVFNGDTGTLTVRGGFVTNAQTELFGGRVVAGVNNLGQNHVTISNVRNVSVSTSAEGQITLNGGLVLGNTTHAIRMRAALEANDVTFVPTTGLFTIPRHLSVGGNVTMHGNGTFSFNNMASSFGVGAENCLFDVVSNFNIRSTTGGVGASVRVGTAGSGMNVILHSTSHTNFTFNHQTGIVEAHRFQATNGMSSSAGPVSFSSGSEHITATSSTLVSLSATGAGGAVRARGSVIHLGGDGTTGNSRSVWTLRMNASTPERDADWSASTGALRLRGDLTIQSGTGGPSSLTHHGSLTIAGMNQPLSVTGASSIVMNTENSAGLTNIRSHVSVGQTGASRDFRICGTTNGQDVLFSSATGITTFGRPVGINTSTFTTIPDDTIFWVRGVIDPVLRVTNNGTLMTRNINANGGIICNQGITVQGTGSFNTVVLNGVGNTGTTLSVTQGQAFFAGNVTIEGNLQVNGGALNVNTEDIVFENHTITLNSTDTPPATVAGWSERADGGGVRVLGSAAQDHLHKTLMWKRGGQTNTIPSDRPYPDYNSDLNAATWQSNQSMVLGSRKGLVFSPGGNETSTSTNQTLPVSWVQAFTASGGSKTFGVFNIQTFSQSGGDVFSDPQPFLPGTRVSLTLGENNVVSQVTASNFGTFAFTSSVVFRRDPTVDVSASGHLQFLIPSGLELSSQATGVVIMTVDAEGQTRLSSVYSITNRFENQVTLNRVIPSSFLQQSRMATVFFLTDGTLPTVTVRLQSTNTTTFTANLGTWTMRPTQSGVIIDPTALQAWRFVVEYSAEGDSQMSLQVRARIPGTQGASEHERYWKTVASWSETD